MKIIAYIFLFLLFSCSLIAQENNGTEYDINDPRNPNCPCHKYQKVADEEYQRELNKQNMIVQVSNTGSTIVTVIDVSKEIAFKDKEIKEHKDVEEPDVADKNELKTEKACKHRIKHKRVKSTKHKTPKKKKFKFGKKDNSRCTHW